MESIARFEIPIEKISAICTDGAPAMIGKKPGFIGHFMQNNKSSVKTYHCIIHQEALAAKTPYLVSTMATVISIINKEMDRFVEKLEDITFLCNLAFLTDITKYLNDLNLSLQGKNKNVFQLIAQIEGFKEKLLLFKKNFEEKNLFHFENLNNMSKEYSEINLEIYTKFIESLIENFNQRLQFYRATIRVMRSSA